MTNRFEYIPEGWEVKKLGDIFDIITDFVAAGSFADLRAKVQYHSAENFAQLVRTTDIKHNFTNNDFVYVDNKAFDFLWRVNLNKNSIILPNIGANIGEVYYISPKHLPFSNNVLGPNALLLRSRNHNLFFLFCLCQTPSFQKILSFIVGASGQPKFNKTDLKMQRLTIPPLAEQEKIAEILGCWDEGIKKLTDLIKAKELQKKSLMQKLLTGKHRLNGFSHPWQEVKLGEIVEKMQSGGTPKSTNPKFYNGNIPFVKINDITSCNKYLTKTENRITTEGLDNSSCWLVPENSILYSMYASIGFCCINLLELTTSQAIMSIIPKKEYNLEFLYYSLYNYQSKMIKFIEQGTQGNLNAGILKSLNLSIPLDINEQQAIADILSKADEEINVLNQKLKKFKEEKKGLMQQLLTGKIRVKVN